MVMRVTANKVSFGEAEYLQEKIYCCLLVPEERHVSYAVPPDQNLIANIIARYDVPLELTALIHNVY